MFGLVAVAGSLLDRDDDMKDAADAPPDRASQGEGPCQPHTNPGGCRQPDDACGGSVSRATSVATSRLGGDSEVFPAWVWAASQSGTGVWVDQLRPRLRNEWGLDCLRGRDSWLMTGSGQCCVFRSVMNRSRSRKHWERCDEPSLIGDDAE